VNSPSEVTKVTKILSSINDKWEMGKLSLLCDTDGLDVILLVCKTCQKETLVKNGVSGMLCRVALVRIDVSEELSASIMRVKRNSREILRSVRQLLVRLTLFLVRRLSP
jgi:hypothetical protein